MQIFTIILFVYLGLVINFFRWSQPVSNGRALAYVFTFVAGLVLGLISFGNSFKEKLTLLETPKYLEYNAFKTEKSANNYLLWRADSDSAANYEWIGDIEKEKEKKFYQVVGINYWGLETTRPKIERR